MKSTTRRAVCCIGLAAAVWLPALHLLFRPGSDVAAERTELCRFQSAVWNDPARLAREREVMRRTNQEWDFMSRTYFALAQGPLWAEVERRTAK